MMSSETGEKYRKFMGHGEGKYPLILLADNQEGTYDNDC